MKPPLWLFPFTSGGDMSIIDSVMRLAESAGATLIPALLLSCPSDSQRRGTCLEHLQESKDFLETVQGKAARSQVPIHPYEIVTIDAQALSNGDAAAPGRGGSPTQAEEQPGCLPRCARTLWNQPLLSRRAFLLSW